MLMYSNFSKFFIFWQVSILLILIFNNNNNMKIIKNNDLTKLRRKAKQKKVPIVNLLLKSLEQLSKKENKTYTLLAVCPNSYYVLLAALRSAKRANAPIKFAATLNQVDIDGGYTGWTQEDLVKIIKEESYRIGYEGPVIVAVDHGGPWVKDIQTIERWNLDKCMNWTKKSFEAAILAGYDLLHVDPTVDIFKKNINIKTVVDRTLELILHSENFIKKNNLAPISYEVGTEEVHGGLVDINTFKKFLNLLKEGLKKKNLEYIWPIFIVAKVGTDLHTTTFDPKTAQIVVNIAKSYGSYIKGHYTDFVANPEDYPKSRMGGANVGPEFTSAEYEVLNELSKLENKLYNEDKIGFKSNFIEKLVKAVIDSKRWEKWLLEGEKSLETITEERKDWILKTSCRYIWAKPEIKCSQALLYKNLGLHGIDGENWTLMKIESVMDKYFRAFNLVGMNEKIKKIL